MQAAMADRVARALNFLGADWDLLNSEDGDVHRRSQRYSPTFQPNPLIIMYVVYTNKNSLAPSLDPSYVSDTLEPESSLDEESEDEENEEPVHEELTSVEIV